MKPPARTARRHLGRIILLAVVAVVVLGVGAGGVFLARFDPNRLKPRIIEAVKRATGRDLALNGKLGLKFSLQPIIEARSVSFANPAGFSRQQMATLDRLQLRLGLLPLLFHRIEIDRLVLIRPDILLETDAAGRSNWLFTPETAPSAPATEQQPAPAPTAGGQHIAVSVAAVSLQDGNLAYRDGRTGKVTTLAVSRMEAAAKTPDAPLHVETDASYNGTAFNLVADTGDLSRLQTGTETGPWPVKLTLTGAGATLTVNGSFVHPLQGKGFELDVTGAAPDLSALAPLLPGPKPPPLRDVSFAARLADQGGTWPAVSGLKLHVGASDLGDLEPGLFVNKLDVAGAALDQPVRADADARLHDVPLTLAATLGPPTLLIPGAAPQPFPINVTAQSAGATATAQGSLADAHALTGANIALAAQIADLGALSPLAGSELPPLKSIAFHASLTDATGGLRNGVALRGITLAGPEADLTGEAQVGLQPRRSLTATLASNHIDLDALRSGPGQVPPSPPVAQQPSNPGPASPPRKRDDHIFSDQPIPFDLLRGADGDLRVTVATLRAEGVDFKTVAAHVALADGKLAVDQLTADLPQGRLDAKLMADANPPAPPLHVSLHASGLALKAILAALGQPGFANANVDIYADLDGNGGTPHALAASLNGSLGIASAGGTIDNRLLGSVLGRVMDPLNALDLVGRGGTSDLHCLGVRVDAQRGVATVGALALSSSLVTMTGSGTINLGEETMALTLRPEARIAGTQLVIPIGVTGPIKTPKVGVNKIGAAESNIGSVAGAVVGNATPLGVLGGLIGADKVLGPTDVCTPVLAAARGGKLPQQGGTTPGKLLSDPAAALRNLLR